MNISAEKIINIIDKNLNFLKFMKRTDGEGKLLVVFHLYLSLQGQGVESIHEELPRQYHGIRQEMLQLVQGI